MSSPTTETPIDVAGAADTGGGTQTYVDGANPESMGGSEMSGGSNE